MCIVHVLISISNQHPVHKSVEKCGQKFEDIQLALLEKRIRCMKILCDEGNLG